MLMFASKLGYAFSVPAFVTQHPKIDFSEIKEYKILELEFVKYSSDKLSGDETQDGDLLDKIKPAELAALEENVKLFVSQSPSCEYYFGATLLQAKAVLYFADLGLSIKCPIGMEEMDCWLYEDILEQKVYPE